MRKYNYDILEKNAEERPGGVPLVTVCNHTSCLDDPCLWGKRMFVTISVSDQVVSHLTKLRLTIGYTCPLFITPTALVYCRIQYNWTRPLWKLPSEGSDWTEKRDKWWKCTPCDLFNMECIVLLMELHLQHAEHLWSINYKHDCKF